MESAGLSLGKLGNLEVLLARSGEEIERAQQLRFDVFYEEMSAVADSETAQTGLDDDKFDSICDHLIVVDHNLPGPSGPEVVATSRLMRQDMAASGTGFYSASEFDIDSMVARNPGRRFLELGRTCVRKAYRSKRTVELMWHGIWRYVRLYDLDVMVGCGSVEGTDLAEIGPVLALLGTVSPAPDPWQITATPGKGVHLASLEAKPTDYKDALRLLPPLIKGYLRLGAYVGEDAFVDHQFGTTDVFLVLPLEAIDARYIRFYGAEATRYAA